MIPPKTFAQWLANYIDKPGPRGELARDWAYQRAKDDPDSDGVLECALQSGLWNGDLGQAAPAVYHSARRAYAVYCFRHCVRYGGGGS